MSWSKSKEEKQLDAIDKAKKDANKKMDVAQMMMLQTNYNPPSNDKEVKAVYDKVYKDTKRNK